ncbi:MAG: HAD-IA family hydrolase [Lachnospiraceae bacterium]|nr:HAD-IA family hydrolase [Lachnospiraceae bacterium]
MKTDALILDVDGTLWDTTELVKDAWMMAAADEGVNVNITAADLKNYFGKPMDEIARLVFPAQTEEHRKRIMKRGVRYEEEILETNIKDLSYPKVAQTIKELSEHIDICVVSNCQKGYIELACEKLGVSDFIHDHECYGDHGKYKAENIKLVAERNGYRNAVYLGDIQGDCDAAHEAGIRFIHAAYGFGTADDADAVINRFDELKELLEI